MLIEHEDSGEETRRIILKGRMDLAGADAIALPFTVLAASAKRRIIVDLTEVSFLASMGIRSLVSNAKAQRQRGGKFVLYVGANDVVCAALETTGIDQIIPMFRDAAQAQQAVDA